MRTEEAFVCSIYYHCHYGKLAEIGFHNCHFEPKITSSEEKGTPEFLITNDNNDCLCSEFKGHTSGDLDDYIGKDIEQYKKYDRIIKKDQRMNVTDLSICYTSDWLNKFHEDIEREFRNENLNPKRILIYPTFFNQF